MTQRERVNSHQIALPRLELRPLGAERVDAGPHPHIIPAVAEAHTGRRRLNGEQQVDRRRLDGAGWSQRHPLIIASPSAAPPRGDASVDRPVPPSPGEERHALTENDIPVEKRCNAPCRGADLISRLGQRPLKRGAGLPRHQGSRMIDPWCFAPCSRVGTEPPPNRRPTVCTNVSECMAKKDGVIEIEGVISEALPNAMFRVELSNGHKVLATSRARCGSTTSASSLRTAWSWS